MEDTIDLGKYLDILVRHWRLVILPALAFAIVAGLFALVKPRRYEARVQMALVSEITSVSFDTAITTTSDSDLILDKGRERRTASLVALVRNPNVARAVLTRIGPQLPAKLQSVPRLLGLAQAELIKGSDLVEIKISHTNPEIAVLVANAWGVEYEKCVNQLYGGSSQEAQAAILQQTRRAKADYDEAQEALVQFISENRIGELERAIAEKQQVIDSLQLGKQTALATVIEQEMEARKEVVAAYLGAQANNRLLAFRQEQEAKRQLWEAYANADLQARLLVFNEQVEARLADLSQAYATKANLEQVLADAKLLQKQVAKGGNAGLTTNGLALLLLKERTYASTEESPGGLQVQLSSLADLRTNAIDQATDLQAFVTTLESRITELERKIASQSKELLDNTAYKLPDGERAADDPLWTTIQAGYLDLFTLGDLADLSSEVAINNPLATASLGKAKELLQLQGLESLPSYQEAQPLNEALSDLQTDVRFLRAELTKEQAREEELAKTREIAWQTYSTMAEKSAEVNIGSSLASSVVRLASTTYFALPQSRDMTQQVLVAGIVGLILGVLAAFVFDFYQDYRVRTASGKATGIAPEGTPL